MRESEAAALQRAEKAEAALEHQVVRRVVEVAAMKAALTAKVRTQAMDVLMLVCACVCAFVCVCACVCSCASRLRRRAQARMSMWVWACLCLFISVLLAHSALQDRRIQGCGWCW